MIQSARHALSHMIWCFFTIVSGNTAKLSNHDSTQLSAGGSPPYWPRTSKKNDRHNHMILWRDTSHVQIKFQQVNFTGVKEATEPHDDPIDKAVRRYRMLHVIYIVHCNSHRSSWKLIAYLGHHNKIVHCWKWYCDKHIHFGTTIS